MEKGKVLIYKIDKNNDEKRFQIRGITSKFEVINIERKDKKFISRSHQMRDSERLFQTLTVRSIKYRDSSKGDQDSETSEAEGETS